MPEFFLEEVTSIPKESSSNKFNNEESQQSSQFHLRSRWRLIPVLPNSSSIEKV